MKALIAYFSRKGNNYVNGIIRNLEIGNTEVLAKLLEARLHCALFKIEPVIKYSSDYSECICEAKQDLWRGARPELEAWPEGMDEYDTIYLGYPNYWGTMPVAVHTFLERYDFSGKVIRPFCTHEGSGLGRSLDDIEKLCPSSTVEKALAILGSEAGNAAVLIDSWLQDTEDA